MDSPDYIVAELLRIKGWTELYPAQQEALDNGLLESDQNLIAIAPTASGKTGIAELAMLQALKQGKRIAYLVPLRALVNDKIREFNYYREEYSYSIFPDEADKTIDFSNANIVIMTFEYFYRNALSRPDVTSSFGLIIVDEFHVLYDRLRGFNLEKVLTIIKLFKIRIVCLSATFENKEMISDWLEAEIIFIPAKFRSVELKHGLIDLKAISDPKKIGALFRILEERDMSPSIIFCHRRIDTQSRAVKFSKLCHDEITPLTEVSAKFREILERNDFTKVETHLISCIVKGIAFHHSGLRTGIRDYVEQQFIDLKIKYLFSTTGLSYGINFPAKGVILYDIDFWTPAKMEKVPVHTYLQMAGRAGRPQFGTEGFAFVVAKDTHQLDNRIPEYLAGDIEDAGSQIDNDDYFQKTILELIYAGRNKDEDIMSFFNATFFNSLSKRKERETPSLISYDLFETIKFHAEELYKNGFITPEGAAGYRLTNLGRVTIDFMFRTFRQYELRPFVLLNRYLDRKGCVEYDFDFMYMMFKIFKEIQTSRLYRQRSGEIDSFFRIEKRIRQRSDINQAEYSAYATYHGWMMNMDEVTIEDRFAVNAHPLATKAIDLGHLLGMYVTLAENKGHDIPEEFKIFRDRIYHGVTEEELPFKKIRGIGRESIRAVRNYSNDVLKRNLGYTGILLNVLCDLYEKVGQEGFIEVHIPYIKDVGLKRANLIMSLVREELEAQK